MSSSTHMFFFLFFLMDIKEKVSKSCSNIHGGPSNKVQLQAAGLQGWFSLPQGGYVINRDNPPDCSFTANTEHCSPINWTTGKKKCPKIFTSGGTVEKNAGKCKDVGYPYCQGVRAIVMIPLGRGWLQLFDPSKFSIIFFCPKYYNNKK